MSGDPLVRAEARALDRRRIDEEDFHAAVTGMDNGRNVDRFMTAAAVADRAERAGPNGESRRSRADRLNLLLNAIANERLRERVQETYKGLEGIRDKARELLERIERLLEKARNDYQELLNNAALHPDTGERIFQYKDGRVETEDGRDVTKETAGRVDHTGRTTGEQKDAAAANISELEQHQEEVIGIGREAGRHQDAVTAPDISEAERSKRVDAAEEAEKRMEKRMEELESVTINVGSELRDDRSLASPFVVGNAGGFAKPSID